MKLLPYIYATSDKIFNHGCKLFYGKGFYRFARRQQNLPKFEEGIDTDIRRKIILRVFPISLTGVSKTCLTRTRLLLKIL